MKQVVLGLIRFYQRTLSPDHGFFSSLYPAGYCKFSPSCSEYTAQAVRHRGTWAGLKLGVSRVARCNPWNKGGYDPVPSIDNSSNHK